MSYLSTARESISTACQLISALSAMVLATLAIYGIFFTDIPERMLAQFRSEIADAKVQLSNLRRQNSELESETGNLRLQTSRMTREINEKAEVLQKLEKDLSQLKNERNSYLQETRSQVLKKFFDDLDFKLSRIEIFNKKARTLLEIERWHSKYSEHSNAVRSDNDWIQSLPPDWASVVINIEMNGALVALSNEAGKEKFNQFKEEQYSAVREFRKVISMDVDERSSAASLVKAELSKSNFSTLLENDKKALFEEIMKFIQKFPDNLTVPLKISLPPDWSETDMDQAYDSASLLIKKVKTELISLRQRLQQ